MAFYKRLDLGALVRSFPKSQHEELEITRLDSVEDS